MVYSRIICRGKLRFNMKEVYRERETTQSESHQVTHQHMYHPKLIGGLTSLLLMYSPLYLPCPIITIPVPTEKNLSGCPSIASHHSTFTTNSYKLLYDGSYWFYFRLKFPASYLNPDCSLYLSHKPPRLSPWS